MILGHYLNPSNLINYAKDTNYYYEIKDYDSTNPDNNVVGWIEEDGRSYLYGNKTGTAEVTVREGSEQGTVIGTIKVTVAEAPCQSISLESEEYTAYVGESFNIYYDLDPYETTDKVIIESDNPDVVKVVYNQDEESWEYIPLKVGEAKITIKCGNQSAVCKVIVEEW